jgi:hypothetical protein
MIIIDLLFSPVRHLKSKSGELFRRFSLLKNIQTNMLDVKELLLTILWFYAGMVSSLLFVHHFYGLGLQRIAEARGTYFNNRK